MSKRAEAAYDAWWASPLRGGDLMAHTPFTELPDDAQAAWEAAADAAVEQNWKDMDDYNPPPRKTVARYRLVKIDKPEAKRES